MRVLKDWLDNWLEYTSNTEPKKSFRLWVAISVIASALRRKCSLPWGLMTIYPNLYTVLVGPSGCRKGTAMGPAVPFLERLGIKMSAEAITREQLIRSLCQSSDAFPIGETGRMILHSSLTIYSQELTVFLGYNNMQMMSDLCDWYDCKNNWTYSTKHEGKDAVVGVWVNLMGATTPDLLQTTLPRDAIGGGLTARMILVFERSKGKVVPLPLLSPEEIELGEQLFTDLEQISMMAGEFRITPAWLEAYPRWRRESEANPPFAFDTRFGGYVERRAMHILKLSMICNASRTSTMIMDLCDLQRAISILEDTESRMPQAFSGVGRSRLGDVLTHIWSFIAIQKEVKLSELMNRFYHDVDKKELMGILDTLKSMDVIQYGIVGTDAMIKYKGKKGGEYD